MYLGVCVIYRRVFNWMIGFIALIQSVATLINYSAISISTIYSSPLHTFVSSVFTSRILATDS
jgi:hypothetical protein